VTPPITVLTWKWTNPNYRDQYPAERVNTFYSMFGRNVTAPWEPLCITDDPTGIDVPTMPLWENPSPVYGGLHKPNCFYRLKAFSAEFANVCSRFIWFDLDCVILKNIDYLLKDQSDFRIWKPDGGRMPCNGSLVLHRTGTRAHIWEKFDPSAVHPVTGYKHLNGYQGSDQAWIAANLTRYDQLFRQRDGIFSYRSHVRTNKGPFALARVVFCNGEQKPWGDEMQGLKWVREHYR
jgi:hypothetical protein